MADKKGEKGRLEEKEYNTMTKEELKTGKAKKSNDRYHRSERICRWSYLMVEERVK